MIDLPHKRIAGRGRGVSRLYLLPVAHLCACLWIEFARLWWGPIIIVDFPFSLLLVALTWRFVYPMFWFGTLGTLWWCLLSYALHKIWAGLRS